MQGKGNPSHISSKLVNCMKRNKKLGQIVIDMIGDEESDLNWQFKKSVLNRTKKEFEQNEKKIMAYAKNMNASILAV